MKREKLRHVSIDYTEKLFEKNSIKSLIDIEVKVRLNIGIEWKRERNDGIRSHEFRNNRNERSNFLALLGIKMFYFTKVLT